MTSDVLRGIHTQMFRGLFIRQEWPEGFYDWERDWEESVSPDPIVVSPSSTRSDPYIEGSRPDSVRVTVLTLNTGRHDELEGGPIR